MTDTQTTPAAASNEAHGLRLVSDMGAPVDAATIQFADQLAAKVLLKWIFPLRSPKVCRKTVRRLVAGYSQAPGLDLPPHVAEVGRIIYAGASEACRRCKGCKLARTFQAPAQ